MGKGRLSLSFQVPEIVWRRSLPLIEASGGRSGATRASVSCLRRAPSGRECVGAARRSHLPLAHATPNGTHPGAWTRRNGASTTLVCGDPPPSVSPQGRGTNHVCLSGSHRSDSRGMIGPWIVKPVILVPWCPGSITTGLCASVWPVRQETHLGARVVRSCAGSVGGSRQDNCQIRH